MLQVEEVVMLKWRCTCQSVWLNGSTLDKARRYGQALIGSGAAVHQRSTAFIWFPGP